MASLNIDVIEEFLESIKNGNVDEVRKALAETPRLINSQHKKRKITPLIMAIKKGNIEMVTLLLDHQANVEQRESKYDESPLYNAITGENNPIIDLVLKRGADVNCKLGHLRQTTALHVAVDHGNKDAVKRLMTQYGINMNIQNQDKDTPLHIAIMNNDVDMVKILCRDPTKINFKLKNEQGLICTKVSTSTSIAAIRCLEEIIEEHQASLQRNHACSMDYPKEKPYKPNVPPYKSMPMPNSNYPGEPKQSSKPVQSGNIPASSSNIAEQIQPSSEPGHEESGNTSASNSPDEGKPGPVESISIEDDCLPSSRHGFGQMIDQVRNISDTTDPTYPISFNENKEFVGKERAEPYSPHSADTSVAITQQNLNRTPVSSPLQAPNSINTKNQSPDTQPSMSFSPGYIQNCSTPSNKNIGIENVDVSYESNEHIDNSISPNNSSRISTDSTSSMHTPSSATKYSVNQNIALGSITSNENSPDPRRMLLGTEDATHSDNQNTALGSITNDENSTDHRRMLRTRAPTVEDLTYDHIQRLKEFLDHDSMSGNWKDVGLLIFRRQRALQERVEQFRNAYCGGGSPATAFLDHLETQLYTIKEFRTVAEELQRNDITSLFNKFTDNEMNNLLCELDNSLRNSVSRLLDNPTRGISNWKDFANKFGYTDEELRKFELALKGNQYSPTECLLRLIKSNFPLYKLENLHWVLTYLGRNDIAYYVQCIIDSFIDK